MAAKDASLYGIRQKNKTAAKEISSSMTLAFTSQLSSLIASSGTSSKQAAGRSKSKKEDIFSTHNKNTKKRAIKDLDDADFTQNHSTSSGALDEATWRRAKRRMEEKARLYSAMKRGDVEDLDNKHLVDFDQKWAEREAKGEADDDTSSDDGSDSEQEELVEYQDEFGRTRRGTRAEVAREERRKKMLAADEPDRFTARPAAPSNIIYGDAVQSAAFNPDEPIAVQMAELAAKRDKEATPPPEEHFDGKREVRTKGVGFFHFSADEETRKKEMAALAKEREETERSRKERDKRKEERRKEVEERKKIIREKRGKAQADRFLDALSEEVFKGDEGI
ncbi:hypothetical protein K432DRAFT_383449 [Lepidopterella palustris CBS 459.81]|uniref:Uncharacterized protein n=1 Tax=Lepidopterella palustris CBS 459.81 TaxID=1314670 RepID=A0A8E2E7W1_9PEZI|nr:hypothetical protein K432DRAFT_383449 [Lepidopterella palustris CBS 459.81]